MSKYFSEKEIACKCGCGLNNPNPILMEMLDRLREKLGRPLTANSICRCEKHNKSSGGSPNSDHLPRQNGYCEAADIMAVTPSEKFQIVSEGIIIGFKRIGVGKTFIHLGIRKDKAQEVLWLY